MTPGRPTRQLRENSKRGWRIQHMLNRPVRYLYVFFRLIVICLTLVIGLAVTFCAMMVEYCIEAWRNR